MRTLHNSGPLHTFELLLLVGLMFTAFSSGIFKYDKQSEQIRSETLRLHIIANSDSEFDQSLKLQVRDKILEDTGGLFAEVSGKSEAVALAETSLDDIKAEAEAVLAQAGVDYPIKVELTEMWFETRSYDGFTLPAGDYDAVRVIIGDGEGVNWWCVMYPPLCIPSENAGADAAKVYGKNTAFVTSSGGTEIRFAIVELIERIKNSLTE